MKLIHTWIQVLLFSVVVLISIPAEGVAEAGGNSRNGSDTLFYSSQNSSVPLRKLTLYSTGIGYFYYEGYVEGDGQLSFLFSQEEMKDILKSFVVQDHSGGSVEIVRYESKEPLSHVLKGFSLDLSEISRIEDILSQAKGEQIELRGTRTLSGRVLGVERVSQGDNEAEDTVVHLLSEGLLRSMKMSEIDSIRFKEPVIQRELEEALKFISEDRRSEKKSVQVRFEGKGKRRVSVGFLRPVPVWKTSYRIIEEEETYVLQGWGIIENTTGETWEEIELSLVAGSPISFIMDLYTPVFYERPTIPPPVAKSLAPKEYEPQYDDFAASESAAPAPMRKRSATPSMEKIADRAGAYGSQGVGSASEGSDMGALFSYDIRNRVTIPKNSSAMLPILVSSIEARPISVYSRDSGLNNPLAGLELRNTTESHLHAGPYTVYVDGGYAGDAVASEIIPGEERLLTYGVDRDLLVLRDQMGKPERAVEMKISGGTFIYTEVKRRSTIYKVRNRGEREKTLIIEHPKSPGWELVLPDTIEAEDVAETPSEYRIAQRIEDSVELEVEERQPVTRRVSLGSIENERVEYYLENFDLNEDLKKALERVNSFHGKIADLKRDIDSVTKEVETIYDEQERIRSNMSRISQDSDLYRRYVQKLGDQEDRIEGLMSRRERLQENLAKIRNELRVFVSGLEV